MDNVRNIAVLAAALAAIAGGWYYFLYGGSSSPGRQEEQGFSVSSGGGAVAGEKPPSPVRAANTPAAGARSPKTDGPGVSGPSSPSAIAARSNAAGSQGGRAGVTGQGPAERPGSEGVSGKGAHSGRAGGSAQGATASAHDRGDKAPAPPERVQCRHPRDCDDGNECSKDLCVQGECVSLRKENCKPCFSDRDCPQAPDLCSSFVCDVTAGSCVLKLKMCDDQVPCTTDYCDPATGDCVHEGDCCFAIEECADEDPCTIDICDARTNKCVYEQVTCTDGDDCTEDWCEPFVGCRFDKTTNCVRTCSAFSQCDDGNSCTEDLCSLPRGVCMHADLDCEDSDYCTQDFCDPEEGCRHVAVAGCERCKTPDDCPLPDGNLCVNAACHTESGKCNYEQKKCDDGDECTSDYCVPESGECATLYICCEEDSDCDSGNKCSLNTCSAGKCKVTPLTCNDGNGCTKDSCSIDLGCVHEPIPNCRQ